MPARQRLRPSLAVVVVIVVVLLVALGGVGGEVCPHNLQHTVANCSGLSLERVPWGLHFNIHTLDLSNNRLSSLPALAFKSYTALRVLRLSNNSLTSLPPGCLDKLPLLHTLDLSLNRLPSPPSPALAPLASLLSLNLAANNMFSIHGNAFDGLAQLKVLDLSGNRISDLEPNALAGLANLQVLRLENNGLRSLHAATFDRLPPALLELGLRGNPWVCDCQLRWLRLWLANETDGWGGMAGGGVVCDGPSLAQGKALSSLPLDELACRVEMRTSGSTVEVEEGGEAVLECVYFSIPQAPPMWTRNEQPIDPDADKFSVWSQGAPLTTTRLTVRDFGRADITRYECLAHNVRGSDSTVFKVTLQGVPFDSVAQTSIGGSRSGGGIDTAAVVVGVGAVCGVVVLAGLVLLGLCCVTRVRRRRQAKRDAVVENVKQHFLANGESRPQDAQPAKGLNTSLPESSKAPSVADTSGVDGVGEKLSDPPLYPFRQPGSPFANGNTYVSFGSEVTDPEWLPLSPPTTMRYEGSHTESTTPLLDRYTPSLDRYTPSMFDDRYTPSLDRYTPSVFDDGLDVENFSYPVYEAATLQLPRRSQHYPPSLPPLTPRASARSTTFIPATMPHPAEYPDYREMRYPYNSSPRAKSVSVGNLRHLPPPRKPPRLFHSRNYVEMTPHDTSGSGSDYAGPPVLPLHSSSPYGVKPGTPV